MGAWSEVAYLAARGVQGKRLRCSGRAGSGIRPTLPRAAPGALRGLARRRLREPRDRGAGVGQPFAEHLDGPDIECRNTCADWCPVIFIASASSMPPARRFVAAVVRASTAAR